MHLFVSYPKSGRTWVRFMVNSYLNRVMDVHADNVFVVEDRLKGTPDHIEWTHLTAAMLFKLNYWQMGFPPHAVQGVPAVVLVRNFYRTLASAYDQAQHRKRIFNGSPSEFLRDPMFGAIKLVTYYNQIEDLEHVFARRDVFVYERLRQDPAGQLTRILAALDREARPDLIEQAVAEAEISNMKRLAALPHYADTVLAEMDPSAAKNTQVTIGSKTKWRDLFSDQDLAYIARVVDDLLIHKDVDYLQGMLEPPTISRPPSAKEAAA